MKNKIIIFCLLFFASLISWRYLRSGYPSMQDDIQVFRLQQFDQCFHDGQLPCRYISNGAFGYGYPLYNFYSPFPYFVSELFHLLGFSFIDSIKLSFILPNFIRILSMYYLVLPLFGSPGAILSSVLYTFAPYLAVNSYVRGAIGEFWALSLLPLVFAALYRNKNKLLIISLSILLLCHNLTILFAIPLLLIYSFIFRRTKYFIRALLWSLLLDAFFLLPAFFEKNLTTVSTMTEGYFYYVNHFTTLKELFLSQFWGYSASMWGPIDGLSFSLGFFQFFLPTVIFVSLFFRRYHHYRTLLIVFYLTAFFALFLTHSKSTFIWQAIPFLKYFQFPWRFLGLATFCFCLVSAAFFDLFKHISFSKIPLIFLVILTVAINYPYFREDIWYPALTDDIKLSGSELIRQSAAGLKDYWPIYGYTTPLSYNDSKIDVISGEITQTQFTKDSYSANLDLLVLSPNATLKLPIVYFPEWKLTLDGQPSLYTIDPQLGLIQVTLTSGQHHLELNFQNTPLRTFANILSLISVSSFIILAICEKRK